MIGRSHFSFGRIRKKRGKLKNSIILRPIADNGAWTKTSYTLFRNDCGEQQEIIGGDGTGDVVAASGTDDGVTAIWTFDQVRNGSRMFNKILLHVAYNSTPGAGDGSAMSLTINGTVYNFGNVSADVRWYVFSITGPWLWTDLNASTFSATPVIGNSKDTAYRSLYLELFY